MPDKNGNEQTSFFFFEFGEVCEQTGHKEVTHACKKGIFEKLFFFLIKLEGEIVVQRKLKVKYKKNEFKKKESKKTKDQAKTETKMNANRDAQKQKKDEKRMQETLDERKEENVFHERDSFLKEKKKEK